MPDIFISYSHEDREQIALLAETLTAHGFSVWWDADNQRGIKTGEDFDIKIEDELEASAAVIVAWSKTSRRSAYVRGEARAAERLNKLVPISLDDSHLPYQFSSTHTEDFNGWQGQTDDGWQRLVLQLEALKDAKPVPSEAAASSQSDAAPVAAPSSSLPLILVLLAILGGSGATVWYGWTALGDYTKQLGIMGSAAVVAVMAVALFRQADNDLHPHLKALARRWLLPVNGKVSVNTAEAFSRLFEGVFGKKHFSWKCLSRSALASTVLLLSAVWIFDVVEENATAYRDLYNNVFRQPSFVLLFYIPLILSFNVVGDYISLLETRLLLRIATLHRAAIIPVIALDAIFTLVLFVAASWLLLFLFFYIYFFGLDPNHPLRIHSSFEAIALSWNIMASLVHSSAMQLFGFSEASSVAIRLKGGAILRTSPEDHLILYSCLATAYITSVWLWLTIIFTPLARLIIWSRTTGLTAFGRIFDVARQPFTALGYLTALMIMATGGIIWGVTAAVAFVM